MKSLLPLLSPALYNANDLSNNTLEDPFRIELRPHSCKSFEMLQSMPLVESHIGFQKPLTPESKFLTDCVNTSREFFVQCGLQGNSLIKVALRLWSTTVSTR
jgi:hypothetical protein